MIKMAVGHLPPRSAINLIHSFPTIFAPPIHSLLFTLYGLYFVHTCQWIILNFLKLHICKPTCEQK